MTNLSLKHIFSIALRTLALLALVAFGATVLVVAVQLGTVFGTWVSLGPGGMLILPGMTLFEKCIVTELGVIALALVYSAAQKNKTITTVSGKQR